MCMALEITKVDCLSHTKKSVILFTGRSSAFRRTRRLDAVNRELDGKTRDKDPALAQPWWRRQILRILRVSQRLPGGRGAPREHSL